jgi:hypothetical protein
MIFNFYGLKKPVVTQFEIYIIEINEKKAGFSAFCGKCKCH